MSIQGLNILKDQIFQGFGQMLSLPQNLEIDFKTLGINIPGSSCSGAKSGSGSMTLIEDYVQIAITDLRNELENLSKANEDNLDTALWHITSLLPTIIEDISSFIAIAVKCHKDSQRNLRSKDTLEQFRDSVIEQMKKLSINLMDSVDQVIKFVTTKDVKYFKDSDFPRLKELTQNIDIFLNSDWTKI